MIFILEGKIIKRTLSDSAIAKPNGIIVKNIYVNVGGTGPGKGLVPHVGKATHAEDESRRPECA